MGAVEHIGSHHLLFDIVIFMQQLLVKKIKSIFFGYILH